MNQTNQTDPADSTDPLIALTLPTALIALTLPTALTELTAQTTPAEQATSGPLTPST